MVMLPAIFLALLGLSLILFGIWLLSPPARERTYAEGSPPRSVEEKMEEKREEARVKGGAVVMIGPIPILVGSDSSTALLLMLMAIGAMLFWFILVRWA
jgi:uncharacterized protein (TIGR00304 family)